MRYYDSFLKGPASRAARRNGSRAKLQYSATITTPADILFPITSPLPLSRFRGFVWPARGGKARIRRSGKKVD